MSISVAFDDGAKFAIRINRRGVKLEVRLISDANIKKLVEFSKLREKETNATLFDRIEATFKSHKTFPTKFC